MPFWRPGQQQRENKRKGELRPQFLRKHHTWGIWECGHESWLTHEEWTAGDVLIHSETTGQDMKAAEGRHLGSCTHRHWWDFLVSQPLSRSYGRKDETCLQTAFTFISSCSKVKNKSPQVHLNSGELSFCCDQWASKAGTVGTGFQIVQLDQIHFIHIGRKWQSRCLSGC